MIEDIASTQKARTSGIESSSPLECDLSPPMSRLSMNEVTTYRWTFVEDVMEYREAGIEAIGVWRPKLAEFGEERGIELLRDCGLAVSSVSWAGGFTGSNNHSFAEALDDACDAVRVAGEMNADCLALVSGARSGHTWNHARRLLLDALERLGDFAAEHDVTLALQPMHAMFSREWTFLNTLDETLDVLDRCNHRHVRIAFDVYHLWQEPRLLERIPEIAPYIATVQLNDWRDPPRSDSDRCLIGEGEIPLAEIARALADADYDGYYEIGIWSDELWGSNYVHLLEDCRSRFEALFR